MAGFFITGTDTGIGKTRVTLALMDYLKGQGLSVVGMKPVATGCCRDGGELRNEDAELLQANGSFQLAYATVNPYALEPPLSPHIAARMAEVVIDCAWLAGRCRELQQLAACVLVEGIGGWEVPLNETERVSDLARLLGLPVIMVVAVRLGCINHALLTQQAMARAGVACAGWIANRIGHESPWFEETLASLDALLPIPRLGCLPFLGAAGTAADIACTGEGLLGINRDEILRRLLL